MGYFKIAPHSEKRINVQVLSIVNVYNLTHDGILLINDDLSQLFEPSFDPLGRERKNGRMAM